MLELTPQELANLANEIKISAQIVEKLVFHPLTDLSDARAEINRLGVYLQACETKLIKLMNGEHPPDTEPGSTQYGLALYILDNHHSVLRRLLGLPETQITDAMLESWKTEVEGPGAIDYDGSLIARSKFGNLDTGWVTSLIYYIALKLDVREVSSWAQFGTTPATISLTSDTVKIALVGDWGTGDWTDGTLDCPALKVITQVKSQAPDYTIHLGDVYYAGTAGFFDSDEEVTNFVNYWVSGSQGSFMLNSNHEMYSGAQGYFGKALNTAPFALQQNTSYFALQSEKWIIIALDTAYYDTSSLFMNGALTDDNQINFIKSLNTTGKKVIVITHHNPTNVEGTQTAPLPLWNQLVSALGRPPDIWYWGHVHNGIVYSDKSFPGQNGVKARCSGHAAIPFGVAYGLQNADGSTIPSVEYFAHELLSSVYKDTDIQQANRVLCGFAMLTLGPDSINEQFIDQEGEVRWSQTTAL
ncbi:MAG TPA: metallophosphoesterase [Pyrinomonadaceae bacterium]|nr:metallophosphoesterase [Pyrinomonadaceae bacterium]